MIVGEMWTVIVRREWYDDETAEDRTERVVDLTASREQLARFAPGVVADALGTVAVTPAMVPNGDGPVTGYMTPDGPVTLASPTGIQFASEAPAEQNETKRKRRTKAQIEADRAREAAEAANGATVADLAQASRQDAAEVTVTNAGPDAYPGVQVTTSLEGAKPIPDGAPAVPFNPFAPK